MSINKIEIQDSDGNIYYPHTDSSIVAHGNKTVNETINELSKKATSSADGLMSKEDKSKLDGVATNANNYTHPNDANTRHVSDTEKANWNGKANHNDVMNAVNAGSISQDPNIATNSYIMTNHANTPNSSIYWHILTFFYSNKSNNAAQIAVTYNGSVPMMFIRHKYDTWTAWANVYTGGELPSSAVAAYGTDYNSSRVRNIQASTYDIGVGSAMPNGMIYIMYE